MAEQATIPPTKKIPLFLEDLFREGVVDEPLDLFLRGAMVVEVRKLIHNRGWMGGCMVW